MVLQFLRGLTGQHSLTATGPEKQRIGKGEQERSQLLSCQACSSAASSVRAAARRSTACAKLCALMDDVLSTASGICPSLSNTVVPASPLVCTYPAVPTAADTGIWRKGNGPASRLLVEPGPLQEADPQETVQWHPFTPHVVHFLVSSYPHILQIAMPFSSSLRQNPTHLGRAV